MNHFIIVAVTLIFVFTNCNTVVCSEGYEFIVYKDQSNKLEVLRYYFGCSTNANAEVEFNSGDRAHFNTIKMKDFPKIPNTDFVVFYDEAKVIIDGKSYFFPLCISYEKKLKGLDINNKTITGVNTSYDAYLEHLQCFLFKYDDSSVYQNHIYVLLRSNNEVNLREFTVTGNQISNTSPSSVIVNNFFTDVLVDKKSRLIVLNNENVYVVVPDYDRESASSHINIYRKSSKVSLYGFEFIKQ